MSEIYKKMNFWHHALFRARLTQCFRPGVALLTEGSLFREGSGIGSLIAFDAPFWHPDLPEVDILPPVPANGLPGEIHYRRDAKRWRYLGTLLVLLAFALPALAAEPTCKVNVQTCTVVSCAFLPGVGPVVGARIAEAHPATLEDLDAVEGIGPAKLKAIKPMAVFGTKPTTCTTKQKSIFPKGGTDGPLEKAPAVVPVTKEGGSL